jgi:hypothetical protein
LELAHTTKGIFVSQCKCCLDIIQDNGLLAAKPASFPMESNLKLSRDDGDLLPYPTSYRRLIGWLIYLTLTWPNISFAVQVLSQFMHSPRQPHMAAASCLLQYLKGFPGQGLFYPASSNFKVKALCGSDWAVVLILDDLLLASVSLLETLLFPRNPRNSTLFLVL